MDISAIDSLYKSSGMTTPVTGKNNNEGFDSVLNSAMKLVSDTNTLQNEANAQEISFALGESDNVHDLLIAEQKANLALQYTVAVRDKFLESYNNIMNMQM
ncbi:MAG: flagellar hook-basal body complex protein FliE [Lachnospiraceae bacterium]|nr:flagellar hook-basal body complex protein FliE [Lachnospiraceae bacterium]